MALSFLLSGFSGRDDSAEQLFTQYRNSLNPVYLEKLVVLHGNELYHYLAQQSDRTLAEDISQQCWLKLLQQPDSYRGSSRFKTWLFSVGRNCLIDELRRQRRWHSGIELDQLPNAMPSEEQQLVAAKQQLQFQQQLRLLPFLQREALMLQLEGFSLADICDITQQHEETIKSRLRYARQFLQRLAGDCDANT